MVHVCYVLLSSGHKPCNPGFIVEGGKCVCATGSYGYQQNGVPRCDPCTQACLATNKLIEVKECSSDSNRECHCASGFFCEDPNQYTCRRTCKSCLHGTFSNTPNLNTSCKAHTNCSLRGMLMVAEGTATMDRVCVPPSTSTTTTASTAVHSSDAQQLPKNTSQSQMRSTGFDAHSDQSTSSLAEQKVPEHIYLYDVTFTTERNPRMIYTYTSTTGSPTFVQANTAGPTDVPWLFLIGGILMFLLLTAFFLRSRFSLQSMNSWKGPLCGKYIVIQTQPPQESIHSLEHLPERAIEGGVGLAPAGPLPPGNIKQVAMEPSGGESISNTVGSIYIFSPGTVVLGSNKSEKKDGGQDGGEGPTPRSTTQQESLCPLPGGYTLSTQEENRKDLSYPVTELNYPIPATSN
ncbi:hypothetical protein UPYG_G00173860 [Umbra pygmaea]|uniref:TNFR-Cys domain-containing protein n=1 Tax=Umbra pygmaea TaxID=75934 RepID=A0ABD0WU57_UMBPY